MSRQHSSGIPVLQGREEVNGLQVAVGVVLQETADNNPNQATHRRSPERES